MTGTVGEDEPVRRSRRRPIRAWDMCLAILGVLGGALVGLAVGLAALLGTAMLTTSPTVFLFVGTAVFAAGTFAGAVLGTSGPQRRRVRIGAYALSLLVVSVLVAGLLVPMGDPQHGPAAVANREIAQLPSGSKLTYVETPGGVAEDPPTPVVVLHGGPGVPNLKGDVEYYSQLAEDGFDVYVYEQVGAGRSERLEDPDEYGLERDVADLEAFRRQVVRSPQMMLVGHGAGARLAANYLAEHGDRVERLVTTSPAELAPDAGEASRSNRLSLTQRADMARRVAHPRAAVSAALLQVNPEAAKTYVDEAELDAHLDELYATARPALHCDEADNGPRLRGLGYFANRAPSSWSAPEADDPRPALADSDVPTLVVKGSCDYTTWTSAQEYRDTFAEAELVYLRGAGHNITEDRPGPYAEVLRAFLTDGELPIRPYAGDGPPEDYEGPAD